MLDKEFNQNEKDIMKTATKNNNATKLYLKQYLNVKKNVLELYLEKSDLLSNDKKIKRSFSQPKIKYRRLNLKKKCENKINDKKISQKNENDEKNIINKEQNDNHFVNKNEIARIESRTKGNDLNSKNYHENIVLNQISNSSNDLNKYFPNDTSSFKINEVKIDNNSEMNLYNLNKDNENFSDKSIKNLKINNTNNLKSNLSSSSFSKNFKLKSDVCKSTFNQDNIYYYNIKNRSENNPILNYFSKDVNNEKNINNFYISTQRKSIEETDENNYMNFFPMNENSTKKLKNIMSCNYVDKDQITREIYTEIMPNEEKDFDFAEFQNRENDENSHKLELIKKKAMKFSTDDKDNNKAKNNKLNTKDFNNNKINQNDNDNVNSTDINLDNLVKSSLQNLVNNNTNNNISENKTNTNNNNSFINNKSKEQQTPLSFINNIYYINNSNYKQYQISPIYNNANQNSFYGQTTNQNQNMNYFNTAYPPLNYYNYMMNNQNNNDYMKSLMNGNYIDKMNINLNNYINNNMNNSYSYNNYLNNKNNTQGKHNKNINNNNENIKNNSQIIQNRNYNEYSNEEILNSAIPMIKEQSGCRFIEEKIKSDPNFANELLFPKIKDNLKELSCDGFGNYFLQALIEILSFDNINKFFDMTQNDFTEICVSAHGTRVIQKIIEKISSTPILINRFIYNLNNRDLGYIFKSPYGNHVIQKFLSSNTSEYSNFIYNYIYKNFMDIAQSKHGVCIIQKCVTEGDEIHREKIYKLILMNFNSLIKDQFGNYLIQYILNNTTTEEKFKEIFPIIKKIEDNLLDFCKSQFSANVIEKCFENNTNICKEYLIKALINLNSDNIIEILLNNHGIYVIQKALKFSNNNNKTKLIQLILEKKEILSNINLNDYKYKIIHKVINTNKELGEIFAKIKNENYGENSYQENEGNINTHFSYNNSGKNKRGRKFMRGNNHKK